VPIVSYPLIYYLNIENGKRKCKIFFCDVLKYVTVAFAYAHGCYKVRRSGKSGQVLGSIGIREN